MRVVQFTIPVAKESTVVVQEDKMPHFYSHLHRHPEIQIHWILEGTGILVAGNFMQRFQAGELYLIGANQSHVFKSDDHYFAPNSSDSVHSVSIFFNPLLHFGHILELPEMGHIRNFLEGADGGLQLDKESASRMENLIKAVLFSRNELRISAMIALLHEFSYRSDWKPLATGSRGHSISEGEGIRMDRIFQYVMTHFSNPIDLAQIASVAHLTPQAFCRYFKKHTGKTFVIFLNEVRVKEACKVMASGKFANFSAIAYEVGFDNVTTFNRVFKKNTGKSPREYYREYVRMIR